MLFWQESSTKLKTKIIDKGGILKNFCLFIFKLQHFTFLKSVMGKGGVHMASTAEWAFELYGDMILRLAMARTGNRHDGEDLLQEVFVRYIRSGVLFENEEHRKAWLIRTTINCAKSLNTSAWKTRNVPVDECPPVSEQKQEDSVYETVMTLPEKYRTVVHLFYYEDMSTKEIAEVMGCSDGTVRSLLSRARKKLQKILKGEELYV